MKKFAVASLTCFALASGAAFAADMPLKAAPAPAAPGFNWTGFYIGGNGGWAEQRTSGTSDFTDTGFAPGVTGFASNPQSNVSGNQGAIGGAQIGFNWQVAPNWLLGAEGDWNWLNTGHTFCRQTDVLAALNCTDNGFGFETVGSQAKWLSTARARVGMIWDGFLLYATGGGAWGRIDSEESLSCSVDGCGSSTTRLAAFSNTSQTKSGWVAGFGTEGVLVGNWTVKAEWLHVDLGSVSNTLTTVGTSGLQSAVWTHSERFDIYRVGLNYHFNWGAPVVAKY